MPRGYLQDNPIAELVLAPEVGRGRAGVEELVGGVLARHVGEEEVALRVHRQAGRVDRLEGAVRVLQNKNVINVEIFFVIGNRLPNN